MQIIILLVVIGLIAFLLYKAQLAKSTLTTKHTATRFEAYVSDAEFTDMVVDTSKTTPVLVDFYAEWCGPCKQFTPVLSQFASDYQGKFLLAKVDVDKNPQVVERYQIRSMPTVLLFKNGEVVERFSGGKAAHSLTFLLTKHGIHAPTQQEPVA